MNEQLNRIELKLDLIIEYIESNKPMKRKKKATIQLSDNVKSFIAVMHQTNHLNKVTIREIHDIVIDRFPDFTESKIVLARYIRKTHGYTARNVRRGNTVQKTFIRKSRSN